MNFSDLDFSTLQDIPPTPILPQHPSDLLTERGRLSMNEAMRRAVGEQRAFRVKSSPDGRYLVLYPNDTPNLTFSLKGGTIVHTDLAEELSKKGLLLPLSYTMVWDEANQVWVGCCQEMSPPPPLSTLAKQKQSSRQSSSRRRT